MKRATRLVLTHPLFVHAAFSVRRRVAPIFTMHRFRDPEAGNGGHDPMALRANLAWLRAHRCTILPLLELVDRLEEGGPVDRTVAFSVDDGYADFARIAAPIFAEFDCPVTVFVTTGFLDGKVRMWWDEVTVALAALGRAVEASQTIEALKAVPEAERRKRIDALVEASGVALPATPPPHLAPISWDMARRLSRSGVTFGPHTVTHPMLARADDGQARFEIAESWRRVRAEAGAAAVPIFCYPNGMRDDFTERDEKIVAAEGMRAAVTMSPTYASRHDFSADRPRARYRLPRFAFEDDRTSFIQVAGGIECAKAAVRAAIGQGL